MRRSNVRWAVGILVASAVAFVGYRLLRDDVDARAVARPRAARAVAEDGSAGGRATAEEPAVAAEARRSAESGAPASATWVLEGRVTDERDEPLPEAEVAIYSGAAEDLERAPRFASARSGVDGTFRVELTAAEAPLLAWASARGHSDAIAPVVRDDAVHLRLRRRGGTIWIAGRVVDGQRRWLPEVQVRRQVRVERSGGIEYRARWERVLQTGSGFEIEWHPSGTTEIELQIRARGFRDHSIALRPDGSERIDAGEIALQHGGATCRGIVVDASGRPLGGVHIEPRVSEGPGPHALQSDEDGTFEFAVAPESELLSLLVLARDLAPRWVQLADVGGTWEDVRIVLDAGGRIEGSVRQAGSVSHGVVCAWLPPPQDQGLAGGRGWTPWRIERRTDADGRYVLEGVPAGRIGIGVRIPPEGESLRRIRVVDVVSGGRVALDFDLGDGVLVEGGVELPTIFKPNPFVLELRTPVSDDGGRALGTALPVDGRYAFEDVEGIGSGREAVLRVYASPTHFLERTVFVGPGFNDLGTLDLTSRAALVEFNRPGSEIFSVR